MSIEIVIIPVTTKDLLHEARMNGLHDGWSVCMSWLFSITDYMVDQGIAVPPEWEHTQGMGGSDSLTYEYETLEELSPDPAVLQRFASIMWRYRSKLITADKDY